MLSRGQSSIRNFQVAAWVSLLGEGLWLKDHHLFLDFQVTVQAMQC